MTEQLDPTERLSALNISRLLVRIPGSAMSNTFFGYIAPIEYLELIPEDNKFHLCLAHLCTDQVYCDFYKAKRNRGDMIFMDNSAYELGAGIDSKQLLDLIDQSGINPQVIVAPDYPGQPADKTLNALENFRRVVGDRYRIDQRPSIMGVPQSRIGNHKEWLMCYEEMTVADVSAIGLSILALPNAFCQLTGTKDISHNRLYGSLYLQRVGLYDKTKWHHYLGVGSPTEIQLIPQLNMADSIDSSSPIWHAINGIRYDDSATGLKGGKIKKHVNFHLPYPTDPDQINEINQSIKHNIDYIQQAIQPPR